MMISQFLSKSGPLSPRVRGVARSDGRYLAGEALALIHMFHCPINS